jgi:hypothetical protein
MGGHGLILARPFEHRASRPFRCCQVPRTREYFLLDDLATLYIKYLILLQHVNVIKPIQDSSFFIFLFKKA